MLVNEPLHKRQKLQPLPFGEPFLPPTQRCLIAFPTLAAIKEEPSQEADTEEEEESGPLVRLNHGCTPKAVVTVASVDKPGEPQVFKRFYCFDFTRMCIRCEKFQPTFHGKFNIANVHVPYNSSNWICSDCFNKWIGSF